MIWHLIQSTFECSQIFVLILSCQRWFVLCWRSCMVSPSRGGSQRVYISSCKIEHDHSFGHFFWCNDLNARVSQLVSVNIHLYSYMHIYAYNHIYCFLHKYPYQQQSVFPEVRYIPTSSPPVAFRWHKRPWPWCWCGKPKDDIFWVWPFHP